MHAATLVFLLCAAIGPILTAAQASSFKHDSLGLKPATRLPNDDFVLEQHLRSGDADLDTVMQRYVSSLIVPHDAIDEATEHAKDYITSLQSNCTWSDINYADKSRAAWDAATHMSRVNSMSQVFRTPYGNLSGDSNLLKSTKCALDFWQKTDLTNPNWWWNDIGIPQDLGQTFLLLDSNIDKQEADLSSKIFDRADWTHETGANLVWTANVQIMRGLFFRNRTRVSAMFQRIYQETDIVDQPAEGPQHDGSFHQHGPELLAGSYGSEFSESILSLLMFSSGTSFYMDSTRLANFLHLVLDGQAWMTVRGHYFDLSVVGRGVTRPPGVPTCGFSPTALRNITGMRGPELERFAEQLEGNTSAVLVGHRHYFDSDYSVFRRFNYTASVRMFSKRTVNARCVNSEALQSRHTADGMLIVYYDGTEFVDVFPVLNWKQLSGITSVNDDTKLTCDNTYKTTDETFVGGVSNNYTGAAAQVLYDKPLYAQRAWMFFSDAIIAAGSNVTADTSSNVTTTLASQLLRSDVYVAAPGASASKLDAGRHFFAKGSADFVWHDNTVYTSLDGPLSDLTVINQNSTGCWCDIGVHTGNITRPLFSALLEHGSKPNGASFHYVTLPWVTLDQAAQAVKDVRASTNIIDNDDVKTCIGGKGDSQDNMMQCVFFSAASSSQGPSSLVVNASDPSLVMAEYDDALSTVSLTVSSSTATSVKIGLSASGLTCSSPTGAETRVDVTSDDYQGAGTVVSVSLPSGNYQGQSVSVMCRS